MTSPARSQCAGPARGTACTTQLTYSSSSPAGTSCDSSAVTATRRIRAGFPDTQVVVLTTYADDDSVFAALRAGARGYLTKDAPSAELAAAIATVCRGDAHFDPGVQRRLVEAVRPASPAALTPRETDVLRLIAAGRSNVEIAQRLYITQATVKSHINNLFAKTGVRDRAQAVTYAFRHGLVSTQD